MPAENRVGGEQCADLCQPLAAEHLAGHGQAPPLVVAEQDAFLAELFLEHVVLGSQVLDHLLLLLVDPAGQNDEQELPRLEDEAHGQARV